MKVFFASSSQFENEHTDTYKKILNYIGFKVGQKNLRTHVKLNDSDQKDLNKTTKAVLTDEKSIRESDAFIVDNTASSGAVGFLTAIALNEKKPILVIRSKKAGDKLVPGPLTSGAHKTITYREYETEEDITKFIDAFIEDASQKIDSKFILILPREIDKYLNWTADFRRMHKAQVVREALEIQMKKDKDWKDYLKQESI